jgi:hypothetical protein
VTTVGSVGDVLIVATDPSSTSSTGVVVLLVLLVGWWLASSVTARRRARVCERYGHAPDPTTVGTRGERCARCGLRLR